MIDRFLETYSEEQVEDAILFTRENTCKECRAGRGACDTTMEKDCLTFMWEVERLLEEDSAI